MDVPPVPRVKGAPQNDRLVEVLQAPKLLTIEPEDLGMKLLFQCIDSDEIEVDIVAIHGIAAHPANAWTYEGRNKQLNWLKDESMLPAICPKSRILAFGYDSVWHGENPTRNTIDTIARSLLQSLCPKRVGCPSRPIVFIGHCFGGLIMQRAYTLARTNSSQQGFLDIFNSTTGLLSLGTPFQGADVTNSLQKMYQNITAARLNVEHNLVNYLAPDNDLLVSIVHDFTSQIQEWEHYRPLLFCFYELKATKFGRLMDIDTDRGFAVNEASGTLNGHPKEGLPLDHFDMNKFCSSEDNNYLCVTREIKRMVDKSRKMMDGRRADQPSSPTALEQEVPTKTLPFRREPNFISRGGIMEGIQKKFGKTGVLALCGCAGIGKTHIAIAYSYEFSKDYQVSEVYWINAGSKEQFDLSFVLIARKLGLVQGEIDTDKDAVASVIHHLQQDSSGHWLMVLDGLDDRTSLEATGTLKKIELLVELIPKCSDSRMLIATQSKELANSLLKHKDEYVIEVPSLDDAGACQLLLGGKTEDEAKFKSALRVVEELGRSPVGLTLAHTYRHVVDKKKAMKVYRDLLKTKTGPKSKDQEIVGVHRSWELIYDAIYRKQRETAQLLLMVGCLDLQTVPTDLLSQAYGRDVDKRHIKTLMEHGMVEPMTNHRAISVTSLIRKCVQQWLLDKDETSLYENKALAAMSTIFPAPEDKIYHKCATLYPCATAILGYKKPKASGAKLDRATLLYKVGQYLVHLGQYDNGIAYLKDCLSLRQEDTDTKQDLIDEVQSAISHATERSQQPKNAPMNGKSVSRTGDQLVSSNWQEEFNLAIKIQALGQHSEAERHFHAALQSVTARSGEISPERLRILGRLAITEFSLQKFEIAWATLQYVFLKQQELLGPDHPDCLNTRHNAALMCECLGRCNEAGIELHRVFNLRAQLLGYDNPSTIRTLVHLVANYRAQGLLEGSSRVVEVDE